MANENITSISFATPAAYIANATNASYPAANVGLLTRPRRVWKSTGNSSGTTYVGLDLGASPPTVVAAAVINVNLASIKIQADDDVAFGSIDHDSGALTVTQNPLSGMYNRYYGGISANPRYWRVLSNTGTTTDGDSVMSLGIFVLLTAVSAWANNMAITRSVGIREAGSSDDDSVVRVGLPYSRLSLSAQVAEPSMADTLLPLDRQQGRSGPILFFVGGSDNSEVDICHLAATISIEQPMTNYRSIGGVILKAFE